MPEQRLQDSGMEMRTVRPIRDHHKHTAGKGGSHQITFPLPEILAAIGPARKATEAIGPVTDVANAINSNAHKMRPSRVAVILMPSTLHVLPPAVRFPDVCLEEKLPQWKRPPQP